MKTLFLKSLVAATLCVSASLATAEQLGSWCSTEEPVKCGLINDQGKMVVPFTFDAVGTVTSDELVPANLDDLWGYIDKKGNWVIKPVFDDTAPFIAAVGLAVVTQAGTKKRGYINKKGEWVVRPIYDNAWDFSDDGLAIVRVSGQEGFIDKTGKMVVPPIYDEVFRFNAGLAAVKLGDKMGYVNPQGKVAIEIKFDHAYDFEAAGGPSAVVRDGTRQFHIDTDGKPLYKERFKSANNFGANGLAPATLDKKWGFIDKTGKFIVAPQFDNAISFGTQSIARASKNDKWGFVDKTGKWVIAPQFEDVGEFNAYGLARAQRSDKWGFIDKTGKFIVLPRYEAATDPEVPGGFASVDEWYVNERGQVIRDTMRCGQSVITLDNAVTWPDNFDESCPNGHSGPDKNKQKTPSGKTGKLEEKRKA